MRLPAALLAVAAGLGSARPALAAEDAEAFARVTVAETELRAGPGVSHRVIYRAHRGESFVLRGRAGLGFWLEIQLADGRSAFVLGDTVERVVVGEGEGGPSGPGFFAPPALTTAHAGFALLGGAFDGGGYVELRPAWVLAPALSIEPYVGLALQHDVKRVVYGGALTLDFAPDWAVAPYFTIGAGGVEESPNQSDEFVRTNASRFHARAGGGVLVSLRWRVLVRLEFENSLLFTEDSYTSVQSYVGGLGTYF